MNSQPKVSRQIRIGDETLECSTLELELRDEIRKLNQHIDIIRRQTCNKGGEEPPPELYQLSELLSFREALLEWLQSTPDGVTPEGNGWQQPP